MNERSEAHVDSGKVMTVQGPAPVEELGITLMHEHLLNDCRCWWNPPATAERQHLAEGPVRIEILGELRMDPFVNLDNCALDDEQAAIDELMPFRSGGRSHGGRPDLPRHRAQPGSAGPDQPARLG